jgi:hypothetical protein
MTFTMDTSGFIGAWDRAYPPDVFPGLWEAFDQMIADGDLRAIQEVGVELRRKSDALRDWANSRPSLFVPLDADIQLAIRDVLLSYPKLAAKMRGRDPADPFVIAHAKARGLIVVTNEKTALGNPNRPKIPDVCSLLGVPCINLLDLIRRQGWKFRLM